MFYLSVEKYVLSHRGINLWDVKWCDLKDICLVTIHEFVTDSDVI